MPMRLGEPAPWFTAATVSTPEFVFDSAAGRYVLMLFLPPDAPSAAAALKALAARQGLFDDARASAFVVLRDPSVAAGLRDMRGLRWLPDADGAQARRFEAEIPGAQLSVVDGAGHFVYDDAPERCTSDVVSFLGRGAADPAG